MHERSGAWPIGPAVVAALGVCLGALSVWNFVQELGAVDGIVLPAAALAIDGGLSLTLVYAGYWLYRSEFGATASRRVALATVAGTVLVVAVSGLTIVIRGAEGRPVGEPLFELIVSAGVGGLAGTAVGLLYARVVREANEARRARDSLAFINRTLRHELLNSVNVIQGNAALLAETAADPESSDRVSAIRSQADAIDSLVEDLRPLARVAAGEVTDEPVDLEATVEAAVDTTRSSFPAVDIATDVPEGVQVAANDVLQRAFENVLANAVEHNDVEAPRIEVRATVGGDTVTVRVVDDGPGIAEDRREAIFEAGAADQGGFGLFFVRTAVEGFGGSVRVEDAPDGAAFVFELPRASGGERNF